LYDISVESLHLYQFSVSFVTIIGKCDLQKDVTELHIFCLFRHGDFKILLSLLYIHGKPRLSLKSEKCRIVHVYWNFSFMPANSWLRWSKHPFATA